MRSCSSVCLEGRRPREAAAGPGHESIDTLQRGATNLCEPSFSTQLPSLLTPLVTDFLGSCSLFFFFPLPNFAQWLAEESVSLSLTPFLSFSFAHHPLRLSRLILPSLSLDPFLSTPCNPYFFSLFFLLPPFNLTAAFLHPSTLPFRLRVLPYPAPKKKVKTHSFTTLLRHSLSLDLSLLTLKDITSLKVWHHKPSKPFFDSLSLSLHFERPLSSTSRRLSSSIYMKWEHDSDSEDTIMAAPTAESVVGIPVAALKESLLARGNDDSLVDRNQDPFADHMEEIQDEVSHMVVKTNLDGTQSTITTTTSHNSTPVCSTSTSLTSLASTPSPASMTSSSKEPAGSNKSKAPSSSSTPSEPIDSRPSVDRTQASGNTYNRSGNWSFSTSPAYAYSAPTLSMSSLIHSKESVYAAVPVSSELYIIPKSSRGFHWNGDLFLKPHQRRSLGVDHMFSSSSAHQHTNNSSSSGYGGAGPLSGQHHSQHVHNQDSSVMVHEIRLDEHEIDGILPSWP